MYVTLGYQDFKLCLILTGLGNAISLAYSLPDPPNDETYRVDATTDLAHSSPASFGPFDIKKPKKVPCSLSFVWCYIPVQRIN